MNLAGKKILVTGAAGTLGGHIVRELCARGLGAVAHVRDGSDTTELDRLGIEKRSADLRDRPALDRLMIGIDAVVHCAAWVDFRADRLTQFAGTNTMGAIDMYESARRAAVARFVQVSTVGAVGARRRTNAPKGAWAGERVTEECEFNLGHLRVPYIMTKRAAEAELTQAASRDGAPELVIVNPSIVLSSALGGPGNAQIHRHFRRLWLPDFSNIVNIVDVRDVAAGTVAALERGRSGHRYILGGDDISVREVVLQVSQVLGRTPHLVRVPRFLIVLAAHLSVWWARLSGRGRVVLYPDLVKFLDYDWSYSSEKARTELGYRSRSVLISLAEFLNR